MKMEPMVKDWALRKFLLTNLERGKDGRFSWKVNVSALEDAMATKELFLALVEQASKLDLSVIQEINRLYGQKLEAEAADRGMMRA